MFQELILRSAFSDCNSRANWPRLWLGSARGFAPSAPIKAFFDGRRPSAIPCTASGTGHLLTGVRVGGRVGAITLEQTCLGLLIVVAVISALLLLSQGIKTGFIRISWAGSGQTERVQEEGLSNIDARPGGGSTDADTIGGSWNDSGETGDAGEVEHQDLIERALAKGFTELEAHRAIADLKALRAEIEQELAELYVAYDDTADLVLNRRFSDEAYGLLEEQIGELGENIRKVTIEERALAEAIGYRQNFKDHVSKVVSLTLALDRLVQQGPRIKALANAGRHEEAYKLIFSEAGRFTTDSVVGLVNKIPGLSGLLVDLGAGEVGAAVGNAFAEFTYEAANTAAWWLYDQSWWPQNRRPGTERPDSNGGS